MPRAKVDVGALLAEKADAQSRAAAADAELERHHAEEAARREARETEFDRGVLAEHDDRNRRYLADEQDARRAFEAAVLDSAVVDAWVRMRAARWSRVGHNSEAQSAATRLGRDHQINTIEPRDGRLIEDIVRVSEDAARRRGLDLVDEEITQARAAHLEADQP